MRNPAEKEPDSPWWVVLLSAMFLLGSLYALVYFLITGECPVDSGNGTCLDEVGEGLIFVVVVGGVLVAYSAFNLVGYVRQRKRDRRHPPNGPTVSPSRRTNRAEPD